MKDNKRQVFIFQPRKKKQDNIKRAILQYSKKHDKVKRILTKYSPILTEDPVIGNLLTKNPQITYKKAGSIGESLIQ